MLEVLIALILAAIPSIALGRELARHQHPRQILRNVAPLNDDPLICGDLNSPPTAVSWDAKDRQPRACGPKGVRQYQPKHKGVGFDLLSFESEACFVPDDSFKLLDEIVDEIVQRVASHGEFARESDKALLASSTTSTVLTERGFALWIPTENFSDMLTFRRADSDKYRHIFDCDTGSVVLLTVADSLGMSASLVETTIPGLDPKDIVQHNYVQWRMADGSFFNWDMNAKQVCKAPQGNQLPFQGKPQSSGQFWAYQKSLRGQIWERNGQYSPAIADYRSAMMDWPERPGAYNGLAWVVATKDFPERQSLSNLAMNAAIRASSARPDANIMDTVACMHAFRGDFANAIKTEEAAIQIAPAKILSDLQRRLTKFKSSPPQDCTGEP